ncbi:MAG TPA: Fe-S cluster assembly protein IscX [Candidatus Sumerlaeota bacterium]|nr:Fe-S cluster assembly protein IscX [Candidatus Sumerlaeota bacterium]HMX62152.1 Fe-S cluster assembly protein IscX [Candidatus Sumerlaeota bacterium]HNM45897.1 Fe-S cluster assembly protein IscX [Candidatus Sumerlaeota bacterium]
MKFGWNDLDEIAIALAEEHPGQDPLKVRFTDLLDWTLALDGFTGKREESNESKLEAIQMAWLEEYKDAQ